MKSVVICTVLLCIAATVRANEKLQKLVESIDIPMDDVMDCAEEVPISFDELMQLQQTPEEELKTNPDLKPLIRKGGCFGACMFGRFGTMADGQLLIDKMNELVDQYMDDQEISALLHKGMGVCTPSANAQGDPCDIMVEFVRCMDENVQ